MKKLFIGIIVSIMMSSVASAAVKDNCGCGLGLVLFEGKSGLLWELLATSSNGLCGNQTFGITTGTLGCNKPAGFVINEQINIFVADNMDSLAMDIAAGEGESLDALAEIAQVSHEKRADLFAALQTNFETIYPSASVSNTTVAGHINTIIANI